MPKFEGIDSDTYTTASLKMSKRIISNVDAFKKLGVTVEDTVMGVYRPIPTGLSPR